MANYLPYYSRIAGNEGPHSTSALNGPPAWTQVRRMLSKAAYSPDMCRTLTQEFDRQTNVALSHSFPQIFFSELPQDPFVRPNEPAPPQFQSLVLPHVHFISPNACVYMTHHSIRVDIPGAGRQPGSYLFGLRFVRAAPK
jgi:hypothetical protein